MATPALASIRTSHSPAHPALLEDGPTGQAAPPRTLFRVRAVPEGWELCFGGKGETVVYPTRMEALGAAFGAAWRYWAARKGPTGVQVEGADTLAGRFG